MRCELTPATQSISGTVEIAGSKYVANRAIMLAALGDGESLLEGIPHNEDIMTAIEAWQQLGASLRRDSNNLLVDGVKGKLNPSQETIYTSASGTFSRFIVPTLAISNHEFRVSGNNKMNTRPMGDIVNALCDMGVVIKATENRLPLTIRGPVQDNIVTIPGNVSSQYISGLLIAAPYMPNGLKLTVTGERVSSNYIDMTIDLMNHWGVVVEGTSEGWSVASGQQYKAKNLTIEADPVSASYAMAIAGITGGEITIPRFNVDSLQGEAQFPKVLEKMGCLIKNSPQGLVIKGPHQLKALSEIDLKNMPDVGQTLAVLAVYAQGKTKITGISHLRFKESDRIADTCQELQKLGVEAVYDEDSMTITGGDVLPGMVETHDDHRMAMSLSLLGLKTQGIVINDAEVVGKSFPKYWTMLENLGISVIQNQK
ncbi:MAG: 3-phosphoshikimate 1-carboxyvinyltransferase [Pseudomonadota bacterium]